METTTETKVRWTYVITGRGWAFGTYAFGNTVAEAKANYKEFGGRMNGPFILHRLPDHSHSPYVNGFGQIGWEWDEEVIAERGGRPWDLEVIEARPKIS